MSARRVLAGSALALLMPASLLMTTTSGSASAGTAAPATSLASEPSREVATKRATRVPLPSTPPTWADEFSGTALAPHWSNRGQDYERDSLRLCSKGDPKAVKVSGGKVRLSVIKDRSAKGKCKARKRGKVVGKYAYRLNGHIGTQDAFSFKYGVAAARIKMHKSRGQHSSFWMQPVDGNGPHTAGTEIDVIEYFGDGHPQGGLTSFIHWYKGQKLIKTGSWIKKSKKFLKNKRDGWSKNYHVFSVEWTPNELIFRIDGKVSWRTKKEVSQERQYPILSLLASDYEITEMPDRRLPQHMYVDWIRVWETPPAS